MLESMTGYGEAVLENIRCEIKSLNHKYFNLQISMPEEFSPYEFEIRKFIKDKLQRGAVNLKIELMESQPPEFDKDYLKAYYEKLISAINSLGLEKIWICNI